MDATTSALSVTATALINASPTASLSTSAFNLYSIKTISEIIQSLGITVGAVFGGLGGLILFLDWRSKKQKEDYVKRLKGKFPRNLLNKDFRIAHTQSNFGWFFMLDNRTNTRHWIKNLETMNDLGFSSNDGVVVTDQEFRKYDEEEEINTQ